MKRALATTMAVLTAATTLAACGGNSGSTAGGAAGTATAEAAGAAPTTVTVAVSENILTLDPLDQNCVPGAAVMDLVFDALVEDNQDGTFSPRLAESWEVSEDGLTYPFHLRDGVTASNGEPVNADDVVTTYQRLIDDPGLVCAANYWGDLESVEKVDDLTVNINLTTPNGACLQGVGSAWIIPDEAWNEYGESLFTDQIMIGSGPWAFDEWIDGQYVHLTKKDSYWNPEWNSAYNEVYIRFVTEASTAISGQLSGDVDAYLPTSGISPDMLGLYTGSENRCELITVDTSTIDYLGFSCNEGSPFADINVRKAFSMSIDRQTIVDTILGGGLVPVGVCNSESMGYDETLTAEGYTYDPEAAKALLDASAYNGEPIEISCTSAFQRIALAVSDYANQIGFNSTVSIVESATLADIRATGEYDAFIVTAMLSGSDPYQFLSFRVQSDAHHSGYVNEELNNYISEGNTASDPAVRDEAYKKANAIIAEECAPMVSLAQLQNIMSVNYGITGIKLFSDGFWNLTYIDYDPSLVKA